MSKPVILDACCGDRMFWIDKKNPKVLFCDIRQEPRGHIKHEINHEVRPDILSDFTNMSFRNNSFKMVVFDPPHLYKAGTTGIIGKKYGVLDKNNWKEVIKKGFAECWRVLDVYGTLIFKWNVRDIPLKDIEPLFPAMPLFGDITGRSHGTIWITFMKFPDNE